MLIFLAPIVPRLCSLLLFVFSLLLFTSTILAHNDLYVNQDFSLSFGFFQGIEKEYLRHGTGPIPALTPSITLATSLLANLRLQDDLLVSVQASDGDAFKGYLGISYKEWGVRLGSQRIGMVKEGLSLNRELEGIRLFYQGEKGLDLFASRSQSRYQEVFLEGNDTMGPYFLGHRNIIENSEEVFLDGVEQKRGTAPLEKDYYVDYQGGFLFFNKVILSHQRIRVTYEYKTQEGYLSSSFLGALVEYPLGDVKTEAFLLWDEMPLEKDTILQETGYTRIGLGLSLNYEGENLQLKSTLLGTDYSGYKSKIMGRTQRFVFKEGVLTYQLRGSPILYESEKVFQEEEELVRNLDYVMDYYKGELTFFYELQGGDTIRVQYSSLLEDVDLIEDIQGLRSISRLNVKGDTFNHSSYLSLVEGDYVSFLTHQPPREVVHFYTRNQYSLNQDFRLGADLSYLEGEEKKTYLPSLSLTFHGDDLFSLLRLCSRIEEEEGELSYQKNLEGELTYGTFSKLGLSFKKDLAEEEIFPEEYGLSLKGQLGLLPYSLSYEHGDTHYQERIHGRLSLPFTWPGTRGSLALSNSFLYQDGFDAPPRVVTSLSGRVNYIDPDLFYLNTRTALSRVYGGLSQTNTYDFKGEIGRDLSTRTMLNYGFSLRGNNSIIQGERVQERLNTTNTLTLASQLIDTLTLTITLMEQQGRTYKEKAFPVKLLDHRLDMGLNHSYQDLYSSFRIGYSLGTTTTGHERTQRETLSGHLEMNYESQDRLSLKGSIGYQLTDREKEKISFSLRPYQPISDLLHLYAQYSYHQMVDLVEEEDLYRAHILKIGFSFRL